MKTSLMSMLPATTCVAYYRGTGARRNVIEMLPCFQLNACAIRNVICTGFFLCFSFVSVQVFAQRFTTSIGVGLGSKVEKKFHDCNDVNGKGRAMAHITQFYSLNKSYQIGIQGITSGRLSALVGASSGPCHMYEASSNTKTLSNNNLNAGSLLLRNRFLFSPERKQSFYFDLGIGMTTYYYGAITADKGTVKKTSFALSPQAGMMLRRFDISAMMILGGRTPAFQGFDTFSNTNVSLGSIRSQQFYVTFSYAVLRF